MKPKNKTINLLNTNNLPLSSSRFYQKDFQREKTNHCENSLNQFTLRQKHLYNFQLRPTLSDRFSALFYYCFSHGNSLSSPNAFSILLYFLGDQKLFNAHMLCKFCHRSESEINCFLRSLGLEMSATVGMFCLKFEEKLKWVHIVLVVKNDSDVLIQRETNHEIKIFYANHLSN